MPGVGVLKRLKNFGKKIGKVLKKGYEFIKDKGIDIALKGVSLLKSGKMDALLGIIKTVIPQAAIATEVVDRLKVLLNKVDENKLKDILKKVMSGDLSELRNLSNVYIKNDTNNNLNSYDRYFGNTIN